MEFETTGATKSGVRKRGSSIDDGEGGRQTKRKKLSSSSTPTSSGGRDSSLLPSASPRTRVVPQRDRRKKYDDEFEYPETPMEERKARALDISGGSPSGESLSISVPVPSSSSGLGASGDSGSFGGFGGVGTTGSSTNVMPQPSPAIVARPGQRKRSKGKASSSRGKNERSGGGGGDEKEDDSSVKGEGEIDGSNQEQPIQTHPIGGDMAQDFWKFVEDHFVPLQQEHLNLLHHEKVSEDNPVFVIPEKGQYYLLKWKEEDEELNRKAEGRMQAVFQGRDSVKQELELNENDGETFLRGIRDREDKEFFKRFSSRFVHAVHTLDADIASHAMGKHSLPQRVISMLIPAPSPVTADIPENLLGLPYQTLFQNEPSTLEYTPQVLDALEKQLVEELRQLEVLKEDEDFDAFAREDDDICCEIRKKQDMLRRISQENFARIEELRQRAEKQIVVDEHESRLDAYYAAAEKPFLSKILKERRGGQKKSKTKRKKSRPCRHIDTVMKAVEKLPPPDV